MFVLDSRLQADTVLIGDFSLCQLLLSNDSNYPWFVLVPKRPDINEIFELALEDQLQLWQETTVLAAILNKLFAADKMNVAALGNVVSQLHMHVIARRHSDPAWPAPVWGKHPAQPYTAQQVSTIVQQLRSELDASFTFAEGLS
ncbi:HIT domain-containing protein [Pseudomonas sp. DSP3-2-2]|uniref:HIT domain-containing protein n=1 Tax=unclassified Pseudomonas TaxID=196821 RepID=UPI003CF35344